MKFKLTALEKKWVLYDIGNSAFIMLCTTIIPIYFNYLAELQNLSSVDYLAYWGYASSIITLIVVFLGPVLGAVADQKNRKKPLFLITILVGAAGCIALGFARTWILFLIIFILAKVGCSTSLIFYDSMLTDITTEERMDSVSSSGYAWGYIGSCIPFAACLVLVLGYESFGLTMSGSMAAAFLITAVWWVVCGLPIYRNYKQIHYVEKKKGALTSAFTQLWHSLKEISRDKRILFFLLAFFCYIDGVYTIIDMATAYGSALGLDSTGLLLALLVTQIVAFPSTILFGRLARKFDATKLIPVCIVSYMGVVIFAFFMTTQTQFWILAVWVGMFQGGVQSLSRSYFAKIIPPEKSSEYFGILDICGKGASFLGTTLIGIISQATDSVNNGILVLIVLFIIGLFLFLKAAKYNKTA